jgi:hypothetical protein
MPFPLQDITRDPTAGDVMHVRSLRARLTATQAALIRTDSHDLFNWRAHPIESTHFRGR